MSTTLLDSKNFNKATGEYKVSSYIELTPARVQEAVAQGATKFILRSKDLLDNAEHVIHDGDTLDVGGKDASTKLGIRFVHNDTPESDQIDSKGNKLGEIAREHLVTLIGENEYLTVVVDPKNLMEGKGRLLGILYSGTDTRNISINEQMVKDGYAQYFNFQKQDSPEDVAKYTEYVKEGLESGKGREVAYNPSTVTPNEYRHDFDRAYKDYLIKRIKEKGGKVSSELAEAPFYKNPEIEKIFSQLYPELNVETEKQEVMKKFIADGKSSQNNVSVIRNKNGKIESILPSKNTSTEKTEEEAVKQLVLPEPKEVITINGIDLPLLPTDLSSFQDNAVLEEVYIRAKGAFAFRSKFSRTEIQFTLAIPIPEVVSLYKTSKEEQELWKKGLQIITTLDAYPFSFIKSDRIKSYLGTHSVQTSGDLMMFGNKKITITQDYRLSNIMLVEVQLLYCNHTPLVRDFSLEQSFSSAVQSSDVGTLVDENGMVYDAPETIETVTATTGTGSVNALVGFTDAIRAEAIGKVEAFLNYHTNQGENFQSSNILSQVRIKVPKFVDMGAQKLDEQGNSLGLEISFISDKIPKEDLKYIKLPRPFNRGQMILNNNNFISTQEESTQQDLDKPAATLDQYAVVWLEDTVAYNKNINPVHSITIQKERSFASHFVGAFQHPYLQYMGKYPARLNISSAFLGSNYDESTAMPYLFNIMLGIVDSNAVLHPTGNAYNYVKVETIGSLLLDTTSYIPNQSQISAKSDSSNLELFNCSFIENSMDKMLEMCEVKIGKAIVNSEDIVDVKAIVSAYLSNLDRYQNGNTLTEEEENFHSHMLAQLEAIVKQIKGETTSDTPSAAAAVQGSGTKEIGAYDWAYNWLQQHKGGAKVEELKKGGKYHDDFIQVYNSACGGSTGLKGVNLGDAKDVAQYCTLPMEDILNNGGQIPAGKSSSASSGPTPTAPTSATKWPEYSKYAAKQGYLHLKYESISSSGDSKLAPTKSSGVLTDESGDSTYVRKEIVKDLKNLQQAYESAKINKPKDAKTLQVVSAWRWTPGRVETNINLSTTAPNGHSEHNTGYAVDLIAASTARWKVSDMAEIKAWLKENAPKHNFRMSFPPEKVGDIGIVHEPWHWAWIGDAEAKRILYYGIQGKVHKGSEEVEWTGSPISKDSSSGSSEASGSTSTTSPTTTSAKGVDAYTQLPEYTAPTYAGKLDTSKAKEILPLLDERVKKNDERAEAKGSERKLLQKYEFNIFTENQLKGVAHTIQLSGTVTGFKSLDWVKSLFKTKHDWSIFSKLNDNWLNSFLGNSYHDLGLEYFTGTDSGRKRDRTLQNISPTFFLKTEKLLYKEDYNNALDLIKQNPADVKKEVAISPEQTAGSDAGGEPDATGPDGGSVVVGYVTQDRKLRESRYIQTAGVTMDSVYANDNLSATPASGIDTGTLGGGVFTAAMEKKFGKLEVSATLNPKIGAAIQEPAVRAALDFISRAECTHEAGGYLGYGEYNNYTDRGHAAMKIATAGQSGHPRIVESSSAAGRYQFTKDTWSDFGNPNSMAPAEQDAAAVKLLQKRLPNCYAAILKGDWKTFLTADNIKTGGWASFPGVGTGAAVGQGNKFTIEEGVEALKALYDFYSGNKTQDQTTIDQANKESTSADGKPSTKAKAAVARPTGKENTLVHEVFKEYYTSYSTWIVGTDSAPNVIFGSKKIQATVIGIKCGSIAVVRDDANNIYTMHINNITVPAPQLKALSPDKMVGATQTAIIKDKQGNMYGTASAKALLNKVLNKNVTLTITSNLGTTDGDELSDCSGDMKLGNEDIAEYMVANGHARPVVNSSATLSQLQTQAHAARKGMWRFGMTLNDRGWKPITTDAVQEVIVEGGSNKAGTKVESTTFLGKISDGVFGAKQTKVTQVEALVDTQQRVAAIDTSSKPFKAAAAAKANVTKVIWKDAEGYKLGETKPAGTSLHHCGHYTRRALDAAGYPAGSTDYAGDFHLKGVMKNKGFERIAVNTPWRVGDVAVMKKGSAEPSSKTPGHACIFVGMPTGWVSDYTQGVKACPYGPSDLVLYRDKDLLAGAQVINDSKSWDSSSQLNSGVAMLESGMPGFDEGVSVVEYMSREKLANLTLEQIQGHTFSDIDFLGKEEESSVFSRTLREDKFGAKLIKPFEYGLDLCFPVVKAYIVIGNEDDDFFVDSVPLFSSQYYELPAIQSFHLETNNDMNPIDIATFSVINPSSVRTLTSEFVDNMMGVDTQAYGTQYFHPGMTEKMNIKAGMKIHIRAGYSNNPNKLVPMFNGVIKETSGTKDRVIECVAQSYASELVGTYVGPAKAIDFSGRHNASTGLILGYAMLMDNINHFGAQMGRFQMAKAWLGAFMGAPVDIVETFLASVGVSNSTLRGALSGAAVGAAVGSAAGVWFFGVGGIVGGLIGTAAGFVLGGLFSMFKSKEVDENLLQYSGEEQALSDNLFGGKGRRGDFRDPENKALVSPVSAGNFLWNAINVSRGNLSQRIYVNIYSDAIEQIHTEFKSDFWARYSNILSFDMKVFYRFFVYKSTAWQIIKEMEYRHPGTLAKPMQYEDRQSMFFGIKEQLYVARDLDPKFMNTAGAASRYKERKLPFTEEYLKERAKRLEPATGFHLINSRLNLISNNLTLNRDFATKITANFYETKWKEGESYTEDSTETILLDRTLAKFDVKEKVISLGGCHGNYMAFLYATQELKKEIEKMYTGKILITGNPEIKAGDYAYLEDTDRNLSGVIKVRECSHHFSPTDGYITEITPGLYAEASHFTWDDLFLHLSMTSRLLSSKLDLEQTVAGIGSEIRENYETMLQIMQEIKDPHLKDYMYAFGGYLMIAGVGYLSAQTMLKRIGGRSGVGSALLFLKDLGAAGGKQGAISIKAMLKALGGKVSTVATMVDSAAADAATVGALNEDASVAKKYQSYLNIKDKNKRFWRKIRGSWKSFKKWQGVKIPNLRGLGVRGASKSLLKHGVTRLAVQTTRAVLVNTVKLGWKSMTLKGSLRSGPLIALGLLLAVSYSFAAVRKLKLTTNPISFFPISYNNEAYTAGISGFSNKGLLDAAYQNFQRNVKSVTNSAETLSGQAQNNGINVPNVVGKSLKFVAGKDGVLDTVGSQILSPGSQGSDRKDSNKVAVHALDKQPINGEEEL